MISFSSILESIWPIFNIPVPGLGMSFKAMFFGMIAVGISVGIIKSLLPDSMRKAGRGFKTRGGNSHNPKTSKERLNDEK